VSITAVDIGRVPRDYLALARPRPGSPVLLFILFTALGLAAAAAAILDVVRRADTAQAGREAMGRARLVVEAALDRELRAADLSSEPALTLAAA
jgi:hypothetical protein